MHFNRKIVVTLYFVKWSLEFSGIMLMIPKSSVEVRSASTDMDGGTFSDLR